MPTGYTACIDEHDATLEEFVAKCAHAFGVLMHRRDGAPESSIPEKILPREYQEARVETIKKELARLFVMSPEEAERASCGDYEREFKEHQDHHTKQRDIYHRYEVMKKRILGWAAPDKLKPLRDFMLEQLATGCMYDEEYYTKYAPKKRSGKEWLEAKIATACDTMKDAMADLDRERRSVEEANEWLDLLAGEFKVTRKGVETR